jgi:hypothetical protein
MKFIFLISVFIFLFECSSSANQMKAERQPFKKSSAELKTPTEYLKRPKKEGEYDPKPQVVTVDARAGKYELRWIGNDGNEKIVEYQRADALDASVEAKAGKNSQGKYVYEYLITNLPESPAYLSSFTVQTFSGDVETTEPEDVYVGSMAGHLREFREGVWWRYAILNESTPKIGAGKSVRFRLSSKAQPGIVGCKATGGDMTLKGVGEHMPSELENAMPGYEEWASGYTIGPVERLAALNKAERAKYLADNLSKFLEAGWITSDGVEKYTSILRDADLATAFVEAKKDLQNGYITGEVFAIIEGLAQT